MTFLHTRDGRALTSRCTLCGMTTRSLSESAIYLTQRGHDALTCQLRRAEAARVVEPEDDDIETCPEGHKRAGNTSHDSQGYVVCLACNREKYAARKMARESVRMCCGSVELGVAQGRMLSAKTNRPTRERRTVLSTPSATNGKEAVDS